MLRLGMACHEKAASMIMCTTRASTRDQAALGAHTAKGRTTNELCRDRLHMVLCHNKEFSVMIENPETWDFPMSRHRAHVAEMHDLGAHTTELFGSMSRQGSPCRDTNPRHAGWFGLRQRPSLLRQIFVGMVLR